MIGNIRVPHHGVIHVIIVAVPNDGVFDVAIKLLASIQRVWKRVIIWRRCWAKGAAIGLIPCVGPAQFIERISAVLIFQCFVLSVMTSRGQDVTDDTVIV